VNASGRQRLGGPTVPQSAGPIEIAISAKRSIAMSRTAISCRVLKAGQRPAVPYARGHAAAGAEGYTLCLIGGFVVGLLFGDHAFPGLAFGDPTADFFLRAGRYIPRVPSSHRSHMRSSRICAGRPDRLAVLASAIAGPPKNPAGH
jgi:hypothetical protein